MTKTLAAKLKISVPKISTLRARHRDGARTAERPPRHGRTQRRPKTTPCTGAVPLVRRLDATLNDQRSRVWSHRSELFERMLADVCDLCAHRRGSGSPRSAPCRSPPLGTGRQARWVKKMTARHRKTPGRLSRMSQRNPRKRARMKKPDLRGLAH
jgi:hypothetical protein